MNALRNALRDESGSELLSFALVLPVLLALTVGSIFFGILYVQVGALNITAATGARASAQFGGDFTEVRRDILDQLDARAMGSNAEVSITIEFTDEYGNPYSQTFTRADGPTAPGMAAAGGSRIRVTASQPGYRLTAPMIVDTLLDLESSAVSRNEVP